MRKLFLMAVLSILPLGLSAAKLTLRDGTVIYGQFVSGTSQNIVFQDDNGTRRGYDLDRILNIDFSPGNRPLTGGYQRDPYNQRPDNQRADNRPPSYDNNNANRSDERRYDNDWAVLPRGSELLVRTDETINSQNAAEGRTYPASIVQDIADDRGNIVIPRASEARLVVRQVNPGGAVSNGNFVLDLESIRVNGREYRVNSADVEARDQSGLGKNKRTAEMVGGGAVLGTLLGAIAGGGKGAAIGAAAGAAAGGGVEVLTKGREIRVPAETVLHFRLEQPLHLREIR
jgi:hypothetical protein